MLWFMEWYLWTIRLIFYQLVFFLVLFLSLVVVYVCIWWEPLIEIHDYMFFSQPNYWYASVKAWKKWCWWFDCVKNGFTLFQLIYSTFWALVVVVFFIILRLLLLAIPLVFVLGKFDIFFFLLRFQWYLCPDYSITLSIFEYFNDDFVRNDQVYFESL